MECRGVWSMWCRMDASSAPSCSPRSPASGRSDSNSRSIRTRSAAHGSKRLQRFARGLTSCRPCAGSTAGPRPAWPATCTNWLGTWPSTGRRTAATTCTGPLRARRAEANPPATWRSVLDIWRTPYDGFLNGLPDFWTALNVTSARWSCTRPPSRGRGCASGRQSPPWPADSTRSMPSPSRRSGRWRRRRPQPGRHARVSIAPSAK
mmetsp:Transcript_94687/g.245059  ORF Transcript_94687/g.245059 Transcript_94687/m.245059 type:complete len:206 (+) Transcript_94687:242-859(+)